MSMFDWNYLENGVYPPVYKEVLVTVLNDEGERVVVAGMYVKKTVYKRKITKTLEYWIYDTQNIFVSGTDGPGVISKPIAWAEYPPPAAPLNKLTAGSLYINDMKIKE